MKKIFLISLFILISCSNQDKTLKLKVDCENNISINDEVLDFKQITEIVNKHRLKYNLDATFKVEACDETSVKVLIDLKNIIKLKTI
jgi:hypothetical protein